MSFEQFIQEFDKFQSKYEKAKSKNDKKQIMECFKKAKEYISVLDRVNNIKSFKYSDEIVFIYSFVGEVLVNVINIYQSRTELTKNEENTLIQACHYFNRCLKLEPLHEKCRELYRLSVVYICMHKSDLQENIRLLNTVLQIDPCDFQLQYMIGYMYQKLNDIDKAICYYKMALGLIDYELIKNSKNKQKLPAIKQYKTKCLNSLGVIYYNCQNRNLAIYYYNLAYKIDDKDPDINNQLGVVYTELRITDKAIFHYDKAIKNIDKSHISSDKQNLLASIYMNRGLAICYECDFQRAIESYNTSLKYNPRLSLAYQNKLLDINYISHMIDDPMYVANLHKNINSIYPEVVTDYRKSIPNYVVKTNLVEHGGDQKLVLGFVSGDFMAHPVSYFMNAIFRYIDYSKFDIHCYSMKFAQPQQEFPNINWHLMKGSSKETLRDTIISNGVDILFDLSGHTGDNRLDAFVLKPAPIQISYCGYPNSSGILSMDYRITDRISDTDFSQRYFVERLLFMPNCFLSYTPPVSIENYPMVDEQPATKNGYITFGSFNRYNKINNNVIDTWKDIMTSIPDARFIIKTKEFSTPKLKRHFLTRMGSEIAKRIQVIEYSDTFSEHLMIYNKVDVTLDPFPYSGTTTSCESLLMGVPMITLYDDVRFYHSQNVTSSLLKNSGLDEFVTYSRQDYVDYAKKLAGDLDKLKNLKQYTRNKFFTGHVYNHKEFTKDFQDLLIKTYSQHQF